MAPCTTPPRCGGLGWGTRKPILQAAFSRGSPAQRRSAASRTSMRISDSFARSTMQPPPEVQTRGVRQIAEEAASFGITSLAIMTALSVPDSVRLLASAALPLRLRLHRFPDDDDG